MAEMRRSLALSATRPACWRSFGAGLVLVLLLGGLPGGDHHSAAGQHGAESPFFGGVYFPEASHPESPLHAEPAHAESVPPCAACLVQLNPGGTPPSADSAAASEAPRREPPLPGEETPRDPLSSPGRGRAPPAA